MCLGHNDKRAREDPGKILCSILSNLGSCRGKNIWPTPRGSVGEGNGSPLQYSCLEEEPGGLWSMGSQELDMTWWLNHHHQRTCKTSTEWCCILGWGGVFQAEREISPSLETFPTTWISETPGDLFQMKVDTLQRPQHLYIVGIWGQQFGC